MIGEKTRKLVYAALFAALTCVMTMIVKIPVPATGGYVNLGDCVVLLAGWVLGPMYGGAAAGLGSMLADLVSGYPLYAPGTFVIKACMAVCAWAVFRAAAGEKRGLAARIGGALAGETGLQACLRETKEELGLVFEPGQLSLLLKSVGEGLIFEDYIVRCDLPEQAMTLQAQEVSQVRWASPQEIRALFDGGEFIYQESELQKVLDYARESLRESGLPGGEKAKLPD